MRLEVRVTMAWFIETPSTNVRWLTPARATKTSDW